MRKREAKPGKPERFTIFPEVTELPEQTIQIIRPVSSLIFYCGKIYWYMGFPGGSDDNESTCNAGEVGSIPGSVRSPGEGNGSPLLYFCLENPIDRGTWLATVNGVTKTQPRLSDQHTCTHTYWYIKFYHFTHFPLVLWSFVWCMAPCKFKVYSIMAWLTYLVTWSLP